jgi:serine protease AprX
LTAAQSIAGPLKPRTLASFLLALLLLLPMAPAGSDGDDRTGPLVEVIVRSVHGAFGASEAVDSVGGKKVLDLPIIDGVSAKVPAGMLDDLRRLPGITQVGDNAPIGFHGGPDAGVTHRIQKVVNSDKLWSRGVDGSGITVALLDTGVYAGHPDLAGRVVHCEDFSHERGTEAECADTFGHGTFMAGLIAGNGAASNGKYKGAAPGASIVSVKAAGYDGSTDVSTILAGIQWVVAHKDVYGIDVLNLSLGTDSSQDYRLSPLNYAVEQAWKGGIAVVVSAGNSGPDARTVMKPGDDPYVITVGSSNDEGSMAISDDRVPVFSSKGPTRANGISKPDVVSPGVHTVSLRSPGSAIDNQFGSTAAVDGSYFKGTGTSMSTATVTGVVAQILQANPALTPDQVKHRLTSTARKIADTDPNSAGAGLVDAFAASSSLSLASANVGVTPSSGLGLLQLDRAGLDVEVVTPAGQIALFGEFVAQTDPDQVTLENPGGLVPFLASSWKVDGWDASSWKASSWKTEDWAASSWKASSWKGTEWEASSWKGTEWNNLDWEASSWKASSWKDFDWDASSWKASSWKSAWYAAAWD